jgi:pimeloyl-ACP methyl ester carboxylesterase
MPQVQTTAGTIEYEDVGAGPVVVLLHGLLMDASVYRGVTDDLARDHRVIAPTQPLGSHRIPMRPDADLSMHGQARIVADLLDALDLTDVTLVGNDHGAAQVVATEHPERLGRLVLTSQEAFDNLPPGLPGRMVGLAMKLPGGIALAARSLRVTTLQRQPTTFGWMTAKPVPKDVMRRWTEPILTIDGIARDLRTYVETTSWDVLAENAPRLAEFDRPALVAWSEHDRVMPAEHGRRLAELLPDARHTTIAGARVLSPLDQPQEVSRLVRAFVRETAWHPSQA